MNKKKASKVLKVIQKANNFSICQSDNKIEYTSLNSCFKK